MFLIAIFFRELGIIPGGMYEQKFFGIYLDKFMLYNNIMIYANMFGSLLSAIITGAVVEKFSSIYLNTIPLVCIIKATIDIVCTFFIFDQQSSFWTAIVFDII